MVNSIGYPKPPKLKANVVFDVKVRDQFYCVTAVTDHALWCPTNRIVKQTFAQPALWSVPRAMPLCFDSLRLHNSDISVDREIREALYSVTRLGPLDFHPIDLGPPPDAQYNAWVVGGQVASTADFETASLQIPRLVSDQGADRIGIGLLADQADSEPVVVPARVVFQQDGRVIIDGHKHVHHPVIVEVAQRHSSGGHLPRKDGAAFAAYIFKPVASVPEKDHGFLVFHLAVTFLNLVVGMAVAQEQVQITVVVAVEEFQTPPTDQAGGQADAGGHGHVIKGFVLVVPIQGIHFLVNVGDEEVHPAVLVIICRINTHAGARAAVGAVADTCLEANFFQVTLALIGKQEVG